MKYLVDFLSSDELGYFLSLKVAIELLEGYRMISTYIPNDYRLAVIITCKFEVVLYIVVDPFDKVVFIYRDTYDYICDNEPLYKGELSEDTINKTLGYI